MPCLEQIDPALGGVAEWAGNSERDRTTDRPIMPFFIGDQGICDILHILRLSYAYMDMTIGRWFLPLFEDFF